MPLLAFWLLYIPSSFGWHSQRLPTGQSRQNFLFQSISGDDGADLVLRLPLMEAELATMSIGDDTSELKTKIGDAKTAAEFGVRKAQLEFYEAFSTGNVDAMGRVWSTESHCRCVHPGMGSIEGREDVMESWKQILSSASSNKFDIEPARVQIDIHGLVAVCSCVEKTKGGGSLEALNIYRRESGSWRMTVSSMLFLPYFYNSSFALCTTARLLVLFSCTHVRIMPSPPPPPKKKLHMAGPIVVQAGGSAFFSVSNLYSCSGLMLQ